MPDDFASAPFAQDRMIVPTDASGDALFSDNLRNCGNFFVPKAPSLFSIDASQSNRAESDGVTKKRSRGSHSSSFQSILDLDQTEKRLKQERDGHTTSEDDEPCSSDNNSMSSPTTTLLCQPTSSLPARRFVCKARGFTDRSHNQGTAYFDVPKNAKHGMLLVCSHPSCATSGRKFRYCAVCDTPVAKRNFMKRHSHGLVTSVRYTLSHYVRDREKSLMHDRVAAPSTSKSSSNDTKPQPANSSSILTTSEVVSSSNPEALASLSRTKNDPTCQPGLPPLENHPRFQSGNSMSEDDHDGNRRGHRGSLNVGTMENDMEGHSSPGQPEELQECPDTNANISPRIASKFPIMPRACSPSSSSRIFVPKSLSAAMPITSSGCRSTNNLHPIEAQLLTCLLEGTSSSQQENDRKFLLQHHDHRKNDQHLKTRNTQQEGDHSSSNMMLGESLAIAFPDAIRSSLPSDIMFLGKGTSQEKCQQNGTLVVSPQIRAQKRMSPATMTLVRNFATLEDWSEDDFDTIFD